MNINVENTVNRHELRDDSDEDGLQVCQPPAKKKTKEEEIKEPVLSDNKKQSWKDEHVEALIGHLKDYKTLCYFNGSELILRPLHPDQNFRM